MTRTHGMRIFAAIGGLTATIALLTGLPAVRPTSWPICAPIRNCCSAASSSWLRADESLPRGAGGLGAQAAPGRRWSAAASRDPS